MIVVQCQAKLLHVLQDGQFSRLGGKRDIAVDVRVLAATNKFLEQAVAQGAFREDLFYRLNVVTVHIPPLRERREEIALFLEFFLRKYSEFYGKQPPPFSEYAVSRMLEYAWPGNIRELENVIERAVILSTGSVLHVPYRDLQSLITPGHDGNKPETLADVEREHIRGILKETRWVLAGPRGAATRLGMNRSTLYFRMKKLGIVRPWS